MSLVGPRPHPLPMMAGSRLYMAGLRLYMAGLRLYYEAIKEYPHRYRIKPWITGGSVLRRRRGARYRRRPDCVF